MAKLTSKELVLFKDYLLNDNADIKNNIKAYITGILLKALLIIENDFNAGIAPEVTAYNIQAPELKEAIQQLQTEYYIHLAEQYVEGKEIPNRGLLLQKQPEFLKALAEVKLFEKEISEAFVRLERVRLKNKFSVLDINEDVDSNELQAAFIEIERQRMRNKFKEIDEEKKFELEGSNSLIVEDAPSLNDYPKNKNEKIIIERGKKNLTILKYWLAAACFIGIIILTTLIYNTSDKNKTYQKNIPRQESLNKTIQTKEKPPTIIRSFRRKLNDGSRYRFLDIIIYEQKSFIEGYTFYSNKLDLYLNKDTTINTKFENGVLVLYIGNQKFKITETITKEPLTPIMDN